MFDFEERALIGWLVNTVREPANQDAYLKVQHLCIYVKVVYHFWPEYRNDYSKISVFSSHDCAKIAIVFNIKNGFLWHKNSTELFETFAPKTTFLIIFFHNDKI